MWASLGIGVSGSLIAAAIYYWVTERNLAPALIIGGAGIIGFVLTWLFTKKPKPAPSTSPASVTQNNKQEFNPQFNPQITVSPKIEIHPPQPSERPADAEKERLRQEEAIIEFLKQSPQYTGYDYEEVSEATNLTKREARDALERLKRQRRVWAQGMLDAKGGYSYFLDDVEREGIVSAPAPKKNDPRCNIHFKGIKWGTNPGVSQAPFAAAVFENEALPEGEELLVPRVKARAIFRHPEYVDGVDFSNVAWFPLAPGKTWETLPVNTPACLVLFTFAKGKLYCRSMQSLERQERGKSRTIEYHQDYLIGLPIGTVEIQLMTESEVLYRVLLTFENITDNGLPLLGGAEEL